MLAAAIATRVARTMLEGKPIPYITAYEKCHEVANKVYEVMHAENERLRAEVEALGARLKRAASDEGE
jgi:predicted nucleic acid-binding Zn ribbon protein